MTLKCIGIALKWVLLLLLMLGMVFALALGAREIDAGGRAGVLNASTLAKPGQRVVVTRDSRALPPGCRPRQAASVVTRFLTTFSRGDPRRMRALLAPERVAASPGEELFHWYSVTEGTPSQGGRHFVAYTLHQFLGYVADRRAAAERMRLLSVAVLMPSATTVAINFVATRHATDIPDGMGGLAGVIHGKGGMNCSSQTLYFWSAGMSRGTGARFPRGTEWPCGRPRGWDPLQGPIIACAKGHP